MRSSVPQRAAALGLVACLTLAAPPSAAEDEAAPSAQSPAVEDPAVQEPAAPDPAAADPAAEDPATEDPYADSSADDFLDEYEDFGASDPLEPSNRVVFGANEAVYQVVFDPLASAYAFVVPKLVRRSVLRFFENLGEPANFLNEVLQLNPVRAGKTGARFAINSTVGVVGLFDPARRVGITRNSTDFGETLGTYGIGEGWYLVVPILGPSSVRDLFGDVINGFFHPQTYFLAYAPQAILATSSGFSRYEASRLELETLRESSVDFYVAMRSAYLQQREADVREARADSPVLGAGEDVAAAPTTASEP
jgi:phospholipid-binding lipoprotein MlaA